MHLEYSDIETFDTLPIITYPDPLLKKISIQIEKIDDKIVTLAKQMLMTMYQAPGVGLSAVQVGELLRLITVDVEFKIDEFKDHEGHIQEKISSSSPLVLINPKIIKKEGEFIYQEGCLSFPGLYEDVKRAQSIEVTYLDLSGNTQMLKAQDLLSVCIQHEIDHLDGIVFLDRLSAFKKSFYIKKYLKRNK